MMGFINSINYEKISLPYFVTLTYHNKWSEDPSVWKEQLKALKKRIERVWGPITYIYRLEFQKRGAPHFHLLLWLQAPEQHIAHPGQRLMRLQNNISWWWNEIVDRDDLEHLAAGTNVSSCRNLRHLNAYLSKYVAKMEHLAPGIECPGKMWGAVNAKPESSGGWLPIEPVALHVEEHQFIALRRILRRLSGQRAYEYLIRDDGGRVLGYRIQGMSAFVLCSTTTRLLVALGYYANPPPDTGPPADGGWPPGGSLAATHRRTRDRWTLAAGRDPRRLPGDRGRCS
jgi:hypothetical protein